MNKEKSNSAARVLRIIKAMQHRSYLGMSNKEIAEATGESPTNVSRALAVLIEEGFIHKLMTNDFAFTPLFAQIATKHMAEIEFNIQRAEEAKQRINTALYR
ncbi:helix-turn-helix domain-containing protein [Aggregatibacter actinomycetemcomitans]|uniref:helix-turn-helix domain-containing protein n=1 Tax=Aggregatibacter actinomycetemcomitans TaxID=714 RepID=UPI00023FFC9C|nr:helix-turn-helix domain-containing protein [Aggregatibacter actinomycetemcomitans]EHK90566.1 putative phage-like DNA-binding protein [Aggregatibacter actinomycetemcomitans RhAA1]KNE77618.1 DNA-binding protein [Aggregatibacter actinomycetemcomitans RhAA1]MBN6075513.1 helix-turn-helix domain-containing protein [Aggregatibacter actinomycetemcomitans]